jgi:hypothetical protein
MSCCKRAASEEKSGISGSISLDSRSGKDLVVEGRETGRVGEEKIGKRAVGCGGANAWRAALACGEVRLVRPSFLAVATATSNASVVIARLCPGCVGAVGAVLDFFAALGGCCF